ncbi:MAG: hypothetical protein BWZ02_01053 [Lentisphaerae bacterium ADurb.BinA184]|nr:MAG: hypothetical protein BWZ02_01053 [Lentisphaerae bacterium ADurb.BinA184]
MNARTPRNGCPDRVALSVWADTGADPAIARHVAACPDCRMVVDGYRSFDAAVRRAARPPADLADRVWAACLSAPADSPTIIIPVWMHAVRIAAAALIVGAVTAVVFVLGGSPAARNPALAQAETEGAALAVGLARPTIYIPFAGTGGGYPSLATEPIDSSRLTRVATTDPEAAVPPLPVSLRGSPVVLDNFVHHVWVVGDVRASEHELLGALPESATPLCTNRTDRSVCLKVILADRQLQQLVNRMQDAGWALVSPGLPQPGEESRLLATGKDVVYTVDLVAR